MSDILSNTRLPKTRSISARKLSVAVGVSAIAVVAVGFGVSADRLHAQAVVPPDPVAELQSLVGVRPILPDVSDYIKDPVAAQQLGKALFWDTQVGSDGQACATCHFHAGADIRTKNQVDPGIRGADNVFNPRASGAGISGPNKQFVSADFPFHQLIDINDRQSQVTFDTNDIFSSQGTYAGDFVSSKRVQLQSLLTSFLRSRALLKRLRTSEKCKLTYDPFSAANPDGNPFHVNNLIYRKVEPRQTPTTVNAVFNFRQFWDGRANNEFNGVDPFGPRTFVAPFPDPNAPGNVIGNPNAKGAGILVQSGAASVVLLQPLIKNASLASQAVGPPLSDFEMSCDGKTFADLGAKLLLMKPLSTQVVHNQDSLFSQTVSLVSRLPTTGLNTTYKALVEKAFYPKYWAAPGKWVVDSATGAISKGKFSDHSQEEINFSLFWGLAIQAYEQLLISDDSPFDRGTSAMSQAAIDGMAVFTGKGKCIACHKGPLFSGATVTAVQEETPQDQAIEGMTMGDGRPAIYDNGFYNIGVRPTVEEIGVGGLDPYGFDLSFTRQFKWQLLGQGNKSPDHFNPNPCGFAVQIFADCNNPAADNAANDPHLGPRDAVDGAFKTPILRNVGLTPPYFHNGGQATLKDVVRFYNRGGDRRGPLDKDTTGFGPTPFGVTNDTNLDPDIGDFSASSVNNALGLTEQEQDNLVQFLLSLTDQRVACHSGVFDHPSLPLASGEQDVKSVGSQKAKDIVVTLPAVGKNGLDTCFPNTGELFGPLQTTFKQIAK